LFKTYCIGITKYANAVENLTKHFCGRMFAEKIIEYSFLFIHNQPAEILILFKTDIFVMSSNMRQYRFT